MEFGLLVFVGKIINGIVIGGYTLAGGVFAKTAYQYVKDYKESISREKEV